MPEGDTVYRAARMLDEALSGHRIQRAELRVPQAAAFDLSGRLVDEVTSRGKHLLLRAEGITLHSHLRMEGEWHCYRPGQRWRRPAFRARIVLVTDDIVAVGFDLAEVRVLRTEDESEIIQRLGPDPLRADWTEPVWADSRTGLEEATARLHGDGRPLHVALLDQHNVAGFGNEYANELCFLRGIDPHTPADQIDARALLTLGARAIRANRDRVERTTTGDRRRGQRLYVCFRAGQPCRRCGAEILFDRLGADPTRLRDVYWCPHCQR